MPDFLRQPVPVLLGTIAFNEAARIELAIECPDNFPRGQWPIREIKEISKDFTATAIQRQHALSRPILARSEIGAIVENTIYRQTVENSEIPFDNIRQIFLCHVLPVGSFVHVRQRNAFARSDDFCNAYVVISVLSIDMYGWHHVTSQKMGQHKARIVATGKRRIDPAFKRPRTLAEKTSKLPVNPLTVLIEGTFVDCWLGQRRPCYVIAAAIDQCD
jgi:hypothetical protein